MILYVSDINIICNEYVTWGWPFSLLVYSPNTLRIFDASCRSFGHGALLSHAPFCRRFFLEGIIYCMLASLSYVQCHGMETKCKPQKKLQ